MLKVKKTYGKPPKKFRRKNVNIAKSLRFSTLAWWQLCSIGVQLRFVVFYEPVLFVLRLANRYTTLASTVNLAALFRLLIYCGGFVCLHFFVYIKLTFVAKKYVCCCVMD